MGKFERAKGARGEREAAKDAVATVEREIRNTEGRIKGHLDDIAAAFVGREVR